MCVCVLVIQLCPTLYDLMDCSLPGSSVHGILQVKILGVGSHSLLQEIFPTQGANTQNSTVKTTESNYNWAKDRKETLQPRGYTESKSALEIMFNITGHYENAK